MDKERVCLTIGAPSLHFLRHPGMFHSSPIRCLQTGARGGLLRRCAAQAVTSLHPEHLLVHFLASRLARAFFVPSGRAALVSRNRSHLFKLV